MSELRALPDGETVNWSAFARKFNIVQKNGGQIVKEVATKQGIDVSWIDKSPNNDHDSTKSV